MAVKKTADRKGGSRMGFSETMKALSDPARREILNMLKSGSMTAGDIAGRFDMTGATVSYHLSQLKKAGLIFESGEKNYIYYSLNASVLEEVLLWIQSLRGEEHDEE
jgi:DNA-binding transcriptional ArsR family regulator